MCSPEPMMAPHGVKQPRNPWSDGPEFITQCPIEPGTNFTYEVTFTTEEGTLWWHAHSEWTRATVHGAMVVLPAAGTVYPFPKPDEEEVIALACWYKRALRQMVEQAIETGEDTPRSDAYTFNGQPGDLCPCSNGKKTSATNSYKANQTLGHYYMAARQSSNTKPDILYFDHANATEILQYRGNYTPPSSPFFPSSTLLTRTSSRPPTSPPGLEAWPA
ncbi:putative laccase-9 [Vitis vinifera]|uniref:Putative laccase-9 n=1 Tax=Vitis vinifera TaxID=29760 RepID=A0A438GBH4_VITVI|nr:putative laccase-9 [Vitis vinifera]